MSEQSRTNKKRVTRYGAKWTLTTLGGKVLGIFLGYLLTLAFLYFVQPLYPIEKIINHFYGGLYQNLKPGFLHDLATWFKIDLFMSHGHPSIASLQDIIEGAGRFIILGFFSGGIMGIMQTRNPFPIKGYKRSWILRTAFGTGIGLPVGWVIAACVSSLIGKNALAFFFDILVGGPFIGLCIGLCQEGLFTRAGVRPGLWTRTMMISWLICWPIQWAGAYMGFSLITYYFAPPILSGLAEGVIGGVMISRFVRQKNPPDVERRES
jgi:hypothetical protein